MFSISKVLEHTNFKSFSLEIPFTVAIFSFSWKKNQQKKEKDDFHWNPHSVNRADCSLNVDSFQMKRTNFMWIGWMFRFHEKKNRRRQKRKCLRVGRKNSGTACIQTIWMSTYPNPIYVIKNANRKRFTWKIPSEMLVDMQKMVATVVETEMLKGVWFKDRS